jgi:hypothetical protein
VSARNSHSSAAPPANNESEFADMRQIFNRS